MNTTLHQLNVLKKVNEYGSITAAANALHITQPAVSNILKQLALNYDYQLTETIGKKIFLTEAGLCLVKAANKIDSILHSAKSDIYALHGKLNGVINVAIVSTAKYFVPRLLAEFNRENSSITIKLTVCNREAAIKLLSGNDIDFVIMSEPSNDGSIKKQFFYSDKLVVAASPKTKLKDKSYHLKNLKDENWLIREPGSGTRIIMKTLFKKNKIQPNITMEVGNNESIKQLIMANMGISIISKQSIELELKHKLIKILPIKDFPMNHPWYFVINKGKHINRVSKKFIDFVNNHPGLKVP